MEQVLEVEIVILEIVDSLPQHYTLLLRTSNTRNKIQILLKVKTHKSTHYRYSVNVVKIKENHDQQSVVV